MKICMVMSIPFPPEEGIGNYVYGLSANLISEGHKVTVITRGTWNKIERLSIDNIEVIKVPFVPIYPFHIHLHGIFFNKLFKSIESDIDIVHIHSPLTPLIKTSLPVIATIHTPMLIDTRTRFVERADFRARIEKFMGRYVSYPIESDLIKRANMITTVATSVREELREYGVDPNEVAIIGNGVDANVFTPSKIKTEEKYILYTGRLDYRKGLFDLVACAKYICKTYSDIFFIITGKGILLDKLQKIVEELDLKDKFKFLGFIDRQSLIRLYQNATIFVLPSHYEGLPTVLLEAMSCGLPVVATAVSGNLDVVSSGKNGVLIPHKSPRRMADAIAKLWDDDKMRDDLGNNARKTIEKGYTWDVIAAKFLECYESFVGV